MVLGTTDHKFSCPVEDSLYLLGMTFDNQLNFNEHVFLVCKKVNNQLNVMIRFRKLICTATKLKLYIMLYFAPLSILLYGLAFL